MVLLMDISSYDALPLAILSKSDGKTSLLPTQNAYVHAEGQRCLMGKQNSDGLSHHM